MSDSLGIRGGPDHEALRQELSHRLAADAHVAHIDHLSRVRRDAMATEPGQRHQIDDEHSIEAHPDGFSTIRMGTGHGEWQGAAYQLGVSADTVGAEHLSMNVARLPPGGTIAPHVHVDFEVSLFVVSGHLRHRFGPGLRSSLDNGPSDFIFVKPNVPHAVQNLSDSEPVIVVVARSTPDEWDKIRPYDIVQNDVERY